MLEHLMWIVTAASIIGTIANIKKRRWCFAVWFCTNAAWLAFGLYHAHWAQSALFAVYVCLAAWGWWSWGRRPKTDSGED